MGELKRGCGYRKIGGIYLCSTAGKTIFCDALPLPILPCTCCDFKAPFSRGFQWIKKSYLAHLSKKKHDFRDCTECPPQCVICHPELQEAEKYGLMWVGKKYYTAERFMAEAVKMGVSKRIAEIPKGLVLGKTWVFTAHLEVPERPLDPTANGMLTEEPKKIQAIFYAFKPDRVEMPLWKGEVSDKMIRKLEQRGITPVLIEKTPKNMKLHKEAQRKKDLLKWIDETTLLPEETANQNSTLEGVNH